MGFDLPSQPSGLVGALATTGRIWTALVRHGVSGRVGRFGSIRNPGLPRGATVVVNVVGTGLVLGETLSEWVSESTEADTGTPPVGPFVREATTADHVASVTAAKVAADVLADVTRAFVAEELPLLAVDAETTLDARLTIVRCLGEADERAGRIAVGLSHAGRFVRLEAVADGALQAEPGTDAGGNAVFLASASPEDADPGFGGFTPSTGGLPQANAAHLKSACPSPSWQERAKQQSHGLRVDPLAIVPTGPGIPPAGRAPREAAFLLQHHGIYQQIARPTTPSPDPHLAVSENVSPPRRRVNASDRAVTFMLRVAPPGGRLAPQQIQSLVEVARLGGGTLRLTTRQTVQIHGMARSETLNALRRLADRWMTTYGACGDTVRNLVVCPQPDGPPAIRARLERLAAELSRHFAPASPAYIELLTGTNALPMQPPPAEPVLGTDYLPRKFKIAVTSGCDCVEVRTHDLGLVGITEHDRIIRWAVFVGGGLAYRPDRTETFPALGERIGTVTDAAVVGLIDAVVRWHRDHSSRSDRRQARLRYTLQIRSPHDLAATLDAQVGEAWQRHEHEPRKSLPRHEHEDQVGFGHDPNVGPGVHVARGHEQGEADLAARFDHLGWCQRPDGRWDVGLIVPWGRLGDSQAVRRLAALERLANGAFQRAVVTPRQNLRLEGIADHDRAHVEAILAETSWDSSVSQLPAMACVAFPTCTLAVAEAERVANAVLAPIRAILLGQTGFNAPDPDLGTGPRLAIAGCANGCSHPLTADVGLIGRGPGLYDVVVGGRPDRLARRYQTRQSVEQLTAVLTGDVTELRKADPGFPTWRAIVEALYARSEPLPGPPRSEPHSKRPTSGRCD